MDKLAHDLGLKMKQCYKCKQNKTLLDFRQFKSGKNKGYHNSYCRKCQDECNKIYLKKNPWVKVFNSISVRCSPSKSYGKRGIKNFITTKELKYIWFRDKAYLMEQPSIDRIETKKHYILDNCRFIEFSINRSRPRSKPQIHKKKVKCGRGHLYNLKNTYYYNNTRYCRVCWNILAKERRRKKKQLRQHNV